MYVNFLFDLLVVVVVYLFWILSFKKKTFTVILILDFIFVLL